MFLDQVEKAAMKIDPSKTQIQLIHFQIRDKKGSPEIRLIALKNCLERVFYNLGMIYIRADVQRPGSLDTVQRARKGK